MTQGLGTIAQDFGLVPSIHAEWFSVSSIPTLLGFDTFGLCRRLYSHMRAHTHTLKSKLDLKIPENMNQKYIHFKF